MQDRNTFSMAFEEAVRTFDYGRAVVMFQKRLPASFWREMTIQQQVLVYAASSSIAGNELANMMFHKLASTPTDFSGWKDVHDRAPHGSDLQILARAKMVESATTIEEWQVVYLLGPADGDHKKIALEKIDQLAKKLRHEVEAVG